MSELKISLKQQKYPIASIENSIKSALQIPLNELSKPKEERREEIIPFLSTHNTNNPNVFPIIRQTFENFQHSKTMYNVFSGKKLINSMRQAPNLQRLLCQISCLEEKIFTLIFVERIASAVNCENRNLIYVVICQGCKEEYIGQTSCLEKERISLYRQHIRQPQYQQIKVEEHLRLCSSGEFQIYQFLQMKQENKLLRKVLYFI